jgi:hypothetical protein
LAFPLQIDNHIEDRKKWMIYLKINTLFFCFGSNLQSRKMMNFRKAESVITIFF